ncbi:MAG TPA: zf-HC2 domain-containing protein [Actinomycetota bacterium]|jgi:hypothetical protein
MDCPAIRDLLPEHVLHALGRADRRAVERHLAWCAGCRKEAAELAEGASLVGHALPPARPSPDLEERVVRKIRAALPPARRSRRPVVAALVAALLAVGAFGWAVAMTGKAERLEAAAQSAAARAERFEAVVAELLRDAGEGRVRSANLAPADGGSSMSGGRAIVFDSPGGFDWALIIAGDLPEDRGPYRAFLDGGSRVVGRLQPSSPGEMAVYRYFERDISRTASVVVRDGDGRVILSGVLRAS